MQRPNILAVTLLTGGMLVLATAAGTDSRFHNNTNTGSGFPDNARGEEACGNNRNGENGNGHGNQDGGAIGAEDAEGQSELRHRPKHR